MEDPIKEKANELVRLTRDRICQIDEEMRGLTAEREQHVRLLNDIAPASTSGTVRTDNRGEIIRNFLRDNPDKRFTAQEIRRGCMSLVYPSALSHCLRRCVQRYPQVKCRYIRGYKQKKEYWWDSNVRGDL